MTFNDAVMIHRSLAEILRTLALAPGNRFAAEHDRMARAHIASAEEYEERIADQRIKLENAQREWTPETSRPTDSLTQLRPGIDETGTL